MSVVREQAIADIKPIPAALGGVPAPIRETSDQLAVAKEREAGLEAKASAKRATLDQARDHDERATDEAIRDGKPAPKATAPKAYAEAEAAKRAREAASRLVTEAQEELTAAVLEHAPEWRETARAERDRCAEERLEAVAALSAKQLAYVNASENLTKIEAIGGAGYGGVPVLDLHCRTELGADQRRALDQFIDGQ